MGDLPVFDEVMSSQVEVLEAEQRLHRLEAQLGENPTEAQLAAAKADYELAKVNYDYTVIQAPISGIVGNVSLTKGDYVSPSGQPLLSIIQYNPIRVVFSITDKDYLEVI